MKTEAGIWIVHAGAESLGRHVASQIGGKLYLPDPSSPRHRSSLASAFLLHPQWVLITATDIAVRLLEGLAIDPHIDPAVVVLDEAGRFAVAILGGLEGGGNQLAYRVANATGAIPVVTTATEALKPLIIGIGCRKGMSASQIELAVSESLAQISRGIDEVREVATMGITPTEPGLLQWCEARRLPLRIIARETVSRLAPAVLTLHWTKENVLDNICAPCALIAAARGTLLVPNNAVGGVTIAIAEDRSFEKGREAQ